MNKLFCFFGLHKFELFQFEHCDDQSVHKFFRCVHCGALYNAKLVLK
jgi:hypothetical protein